ncbi:outer membrane beta-barrel protein [Pleurocapsales cyanobacterium LEGE 10410]|nr:outer membrane beta-barrel protein [Pleurocapsales cyanobacterium LEGE 10410]
MNLKKTVLLATLLSAFPLAGIQAQDLDNYQVGCNAGAECNDFVGSYEQADGDEVAQVRRRRTRTRRTRRTDTKYYVGGTLGIFFPSEVEDLQVLADTVDPGTGFGGSLYGGYKFNQYISADIEGLIFFGDAEPLDSSYTSYGFFVNPRFTYTFERDTLSDNLSGLYVFASPGIGIAGLDFGDDLGDTLEPSDNDSGSGFAFQIKAGAGYPVSDKIDIIGQVRYLNALDAFEVTEVGVDGITSTEDQGFDAFSVELGANYKF